MRKTCANWVVEWKKEENLELLNGTTDKTTISQQFRKPLVSGLGRLLFVQMNRCKWKKSGKKLFKNVASFLIRGLIKFVPLTKPRHWLISVSVGCFLLDWCQVRSPTWFSGSTMLPVQVGLSRCIYDGKNLEKLSHNELQKKHQINLKSRRSTKNLEEQMKLKTLREVYEKCLSELKSVA